MYMGTRLVLRLLGKRILKSRDSYGTVPCGFTFPKSHAASREHTAT